MADAIGRDVRGEPGDEIVVDRLVDEDPRAGHAVLALQEEGRHRDAGDGDIEIGVGEDDNGGFAAELERDLLHRLDSAAHDQLADLGRSGEGDLVDVRMRDQRGAPRPRRSRK